ncbi:Nucleolar RNA helicase 2 [Trichoplax sp. H2]|uniref:RNA helicase n=1 Tax=Trichoplax adhaerens TaxID=10228 RepID=B3RVR9_TRIAD|nr:hypothetical protein TRIADDRAFT_55752 [Trichoplax adhaerens]EDV26044.1 hypothetical protein TRIADDRAFT_55752 [Trichoplax adhaerens]RDD47018.1 Nucleolar RNA helicase 2 [Trichoplax sp. H2]|eukprot:XP_002112077.1 hypothetical protein TRIADDRAFT_55752 [Trichoplax adhaerens]
MKQNHEENTSTMKRKAISPPDGRNHKKHRSSQKSNGDSELPEHDSGSMEEKGDFKKFRISSAIADSLKERGITYLFPIQAQTFDYVYDGQDVIGQARTGTGKTLSFALPITEKLIKKKRSDDKIRPPKVLVLAPTRELAIQITSEFKALSGSLKVVCIYGGVPYAEQENHLRNGIDIVIGTPGRIKDHIDRKNLVLSKLKHVVLDEVDRMLDMGFCDIVEEILSHAYVKDRHPQTLLFSATMPKWALKTIDKYMKSDKKIVDLIGKDALRTSTTVEHKVISCPYHERAATIGDLVKVYGGDHARTIIFSPTKKEANELALSSVLKQEVQVLHGDIQQAQREVTLKGFREGNFPCLVATDVAARGLDIPEVDLVIQCEPPKDADTYIHRSGRTGRANRTGICITFYKPTHQDRIKSIESEAGINFCRIGAPQLGDIIQATSRDAAKSLDSVPAEVLVHFESIASEIIETKGAVKALSAALAHISGYTSITNRSLLSSREGFTTYVMRSQWEFRSVSYMWKVIEVELSSAIKAEVRGMRMCKDKKGVVFDLPSNLCDTVKENWKNARNIELDIADALPELLDTSSSFEKPSHFNNNSRFGNNYNRHERRPFNQMASRNYTNGRGNNPRGFRARNF